MPKRSCDEDSDEYIRRKMRKIEKKLRRRKRRSRRISSYSSDSSENNGTLVLSSTEDGQEPPLTESVVTNGLPADPTVDVDLETVPGPSQPDNEDTLDSDILELLGASPSEPKKMGENIQKEIALRWEHYVTSGLSKDTRKELLDKHLVPGNCPKLAAPLLNPEIKAAMPDTMIGKDKTCQSKQSQLASSIACIGDALTKIFRSEHKDPSVIKSLLEGAQLLCDLQHYESMKRRSLICASIKKEIKNQIYETTIDKYLFGENLAETLKAAKAINKSGSELKATKPKTGTSQRAQSRALNPKPQLANSRQPARRRQEPASYASVPATQPPALTQWHQYPAQPPQLPLAPPPPPPPLPPPPPPPQTQQRPKQRPYQRR